MSFPAISVLDAIPIGPGVSASQALAWSTEMARTAERLGCVRFWVVEHHAIPDIGCSSPAVFIAHLAAHTSAIRLGAGGVMLPNHTPLIVAEQFSMLEGLCPGRIDLGIGRAPGTDKKTAAALGRDAESGTPEEYEARLGELEGFLRRSFPSEHPYKGIRLPLKVRAPAIYHLGSSVSSAYAAGRRGLAYAFAYHLRPDEVAEAITSYRAAFRQSAELQRPYAIATVSVVCAPTLEEAEEAACRAATIRLRAMRAFAQERTSVNDVGEAISDADEHRLVQEALTANRVVIGTGDAVVSRLLSMSREWGVDEIMLTSIEYDGPSRVRTLTSLLDAYQKGRSTEGGGLQTTTLGEQSLSTCNSSQPTACRRGREKSKIAHRG
ncbi:MAG: MsnO8 family LLM class oxidoreductase [Candidatus Poribacteria bacterium]|nr:MsnO8 family LLM class oxidoreductase [Candidatus Poribacteria bacterium]